MLSYAFDFCLADGARLAGTGHAGATPRVLATFRDSATAEAVATSPPIVRIFLEEAGFAFAGNGQGPRVAPPSDAGEQLRQRLIAQVKGALANRALKKALIKASTESAFDISAFIGDLMGPTAAEHRAETAPQAATVKPGRVSPRRQSGEAAARVTPGRPQRPDPAKTARSRPPAYESCAALAPQAARDDDLGPVSPRRPEDIRRDAEPLKL